MVKVESLRLVPRRPSGDNGGVVTGAACALRAWDPPADAAAATVDGDALLALLAAGDPPAFATDSRDRIVFWNRGMTDLVDRASQQALGTRCYETLAGRDVFGNRFCYANCTVLATARAGDPVCGFELTVATGGPDRQPVAFTIVKIPGARPDLFTLVHVVQPVARDGRLAGLLARLGGGGPVGAGTSVTAEPTAAPPPLTRRETEVLRHLAAGLQNKEVAQTLDLSLATVRNHVHNILEKLGVHSRLEAVSLSFRNGWVLRDDGPARPVAD